MGTSRFSNNANLTNHTQLQISDNTATTKVIKEIKYYQGLPEIPTAEATPDTVLFRDRGSLQGVEIGEDQVEFPEFSITIDMTAADTREVTAAYKSDWFNIMNKFADPADGTTDLTSTNSGTVSVKNSFDPSSATTKSVTIPSDIDTLRLEMLFKDGTRTFGYKWEQVQPLGVTFGDNNGAASMTLRFKIWCAPTEIESLTTNA
jgi:hypothetical protein